ncbi:tRNA (adenosine(37)-N6)-threonylcarbamoyltransferase complex ATPase subunit type 1 TsaE [Pseudoclavibacter endophyticus]|uniref:tRNA threonylcarbamoyladenosine biosynthesis protein TsaE n=2 Tax=Pseudoclavibacter endophyticus TaxID=1778590 RepID=A0A6H9WHQ1_9MICO|nr:tRNA (adenosine(37)-N6)-threonylcarbamoyltransferase complex ATPase subunit type 1 TsaE [Pseudoclavibacter endophyticus]KAB1650489.1 tRNA (adenosine(37)-N6)-threonylcarbamoyltransferase complex ATPase subunit type 1 TsaE [Pseudoclavibacter endophyticus]
MADFGGRLAALLGPGDVVVLTGPLGAGKTTLTRGLGEGLGVRGPVSSPTFVLARTHPSLGDGPPLVHVDAYRLRDALDLDDLDLDLDASVTVVEWGRGLVDAIADEWLDVELERPRATESAGGAAGGGEVPDASGDPDVPRTVRLTPVGPRWSTRGALAALDALIGGGAQAETGGTRGDGAAADGSAARPDEPRA